MTENGGEPVQIQEPAGSAGGASHLPDRHRFYADLTRLCERSAEEARPFVVALVDIAGVDEVLAVFGPGTWDATIRALALRLDDALPDGATAYQVRSTRFAVVFAAADYQAAANQSRAVVERLAQPFSIESLPVSFDGIVGIARFPNHGTEAGQLARCALVALSECTKLGESYAIYDPAWDERHRKHYKLLLDLDSALRSDTELLLHYQPKLDLGTGRCFGVEALLRWDHGTRGMVPPGEFIPSAEQTTMIHAITERVVTMGLEQLAVWGLEGQTPTLSVNLSARDLADASLPERIEDIVKFYGSRPAHLEFEVTETAIMENHRVATDNIMRLKRLGATVAIDDFGTGHSSLSWLAQLPCDTLKIDRSFIARLDDERNRTIVRASITLAHELGMTVVAEGVETEETLATLRGWDCDAAQGFLIGRPSAEPDFADRQLPG